MNIVNLTPHNLDIYSTVTTLNRVLDIVKTLQEENKNLKAQLAIYTPDWNNAPVEANWWARDSDGTGYWYEEEPKEYRGVGWIANGADWNSNIWENLNWRETKQQRPNSDIKD